MRNTTRFLTAFQGILLAGASAVPLSPDLGPDELAVQRDEADPAMILVEDTALPAGAGIEPEAAMPADTAVLQMTSGTTGRSRAARMSHGNLVANALQNVRWFSWGADEVVLGVLPLCHTWGLCVNASSTFAVGGTLVLVDGFDAEAVFDLADRHRATVLYGSATMFHRLADHAEVRPGGLATLRHAKAGAMLSQGGLKERWDALFPQAPLQQGYGLTEASPECHDNPPHRHKAGTVGLPIQDTDCRIVDPDDPGRELRPGEEGEVCLRGPQVTDGYFRRPRDSEVAFVDGWLRTGDVGVMDEEGYLTIVDRLKDMLKFRGYTVTPNVVEECLLRHPAVREAVVVGREDARDGDVPTAFVVLSDDVPPETLEEHCRARLARYEVPREIRAIEAIPRNRVGKPLRRVLRDGLRGGDETNRGRAT
jgi:long-chain acyl-CoA synthetase